MKLESRVFAGGWFERAAVAVVLLISWASVGMTAETPFDQARAAVQEMMGEAITADALARSPAEKGRAQERLGLAIALRAMMDLEDSGRVYESAHLVPFSSHAGHVQEMLGAAIMDAAWAKTYRERSRAQEVLGMLIVNGTLLELGEMPIGMGGENGTVPPGSGGPRSGNYPSGRFFIDHEAR